MGGLKAEASALRTLAAECRAAGNERGAVICEQAASALDAVTTPYALDTESLDHWRIVRNGTVVRSFPRLAGDENRDEAGRRVAALNEADRPVPEEGR